MTRNPLPELLLTEYRAWVQRILDLRDTVRAGCACRGQDQQTADHLSTRLVLRMFAQPNVVRVGDLIDSASAGFPIQHLAGLGVHPAVSRSVSWHQMETHLMRAPEVLQAAIVCVFVHGDSIERMAQRTGWGLARARRVRAEAIEYLRVDGVDDVDDESDASGMPHRSQPRRQRPWSGPGRPLIHRLPYSPPRRMRQPTSASTPTPIAWRSGPSKLVNSYGTTNSRRSWTGPRHRLHGGSSRAR